MKWPAQAFERHWRLQLEPPGVGGSWLVVWLGGHRCENRVVVTILQSLAPSASYSMAPFGLFMATDGAITAFAGIRCPEYQTPSSCAVKAAKDGDGKFIEMGDTGFAAYCVHCQVEVVADGYSREHEKTITDGAVTFHGSVLSKTGKQRNRDEAYSRLAYLCDKLELNGQQIQTARRLLTAMIDEGAAKGGRGFPVLEVIAAHVAARMFNRSAPLQHVIETHREWIDDDGKYKTIREISYRAVNRLMQKMMRTGAIPRPRPLSYEILAANPWVRDNVPPDVVSVATNYCRLPVDGTPDAIAAASLLLAAKDRRLSDVPDDYVGGEAKRRLTAAQASEIFPGTSVRTIKRKMKEMREANGEVILSNPPDELLRQTPEQNIRDGFRNAGVDVEDKLPLNRKDVEIINALRRSD